MLTGERGGTTAYSGGVVGYNVAFTAKNAYILGCSNTGRVSAVSRCGGIVGENFGSASASVGAIIVGCYNQGYIKSDADVEVGGIAGAIGDYSEIWGCYNAGSISSDNASNEDVCAIMGRDVFHEAVDLLNTNYWLTGSAPKGYSNVLENQVVDCVSKSAAELNSQETVDALNAAISVWNAANNNRCNYKFEVGGQYPILTGN